MSNNQAVHTFDENFFSSIAVPLVKDYSRLSSSPSRDQPCDSSYFEKHFPNLECDTPVKMRLPAAHRESGDNLPSGTMDYFLSSSSSSETTVQAAEQPESEPTTHKQQHPEPENKREPLKIVAHEKSAPTPSMEAYGENQLIQGMEKLTMFAPKAPEERLSQRRRSEQKKKLDEESKRRSVMTPASGTTSSVNRSRSISTKRPLSRGPAAVRETFVKRSNSNNSTVSRTIPAPISTAGPGVVTRSMAAARSAGNASSKPMTRRSAMPVKVIPKTPLASTRVAVSATNDIATKPIVRRSVMPIKIISKTPISAVKKNFTPIGTDRSRDRTRRSNTTGSPSTIPPKVASVKRTSTPIAPQRRSASATKINTPVVPQQLKASRAAFFDRLAMPKTVTPSRPAHNEPTSSLRKSVTRPVPTYVYNFTSTGLPTSGGLHGIRAPSKDRSAQKAGTGISSSSSQPTKR